LISRILLEESFPLVREVVQIGEPEILNAELEESFELVVTHITFSEKFRNL
jgi:hypothetical protein